MKELLEKQRKVQHLYLRAGFGEDLDTVKRSLDKSLDKLVAVMMRQSRTPVELEAEGLDIPEPSEMNMLEQMGQALRIKKSLEDVRKLNVAWVRRMAYEDTQIQEKMTLFWHDHFACRLRAPYMVLKQHNTLREHALGDFGSLLKAMSKDPGMLQFLNNQQNRKAHPNENFARELLELFTLGRGFYTEKDIQEAARAFTGWGFNKDRAFVFRKRQHDYGVKEFMGKRGNFDGDDILDILLENKQTASFITHKIYRYFVNAELDLAVAEKWADAFYQSSYDITQLMTTIFTSDHFYEEKHIGTRIKSPIEYLAGLMRMLQMDFTEDQSILFIQKILGQVLFSPPNVAGWHDGRSWIDSTTLIARTKIPQAIIYSSDLAVDLKGSFTKEEGLQIRRGKINRKIDATVDWKVLLKQTKGMADNEMTQLLQHYFLQRPSSYLTPDILETHTDIGDKQTRLKALVMRICGSPEFQLC